MRTRIALLDPKFRRLVVLMSCMTFSIAFAQTETSPQMEAKNSLFVEWFVSRSLSFIAEYASSLSYGSSSHKDTAEVQAPSGDFALTNESKREASGFGLGSQSVKFGLAVYF